MIEYNGIGLRAIEESDLDVLFELVNDPYISTMVVGWGVPLSKMQQSQWIQNQHANDKTVRLVVVDLETNEPIGLSGLWDIDWQNSSALTATKLLPSKAKKGFGRASIMLTMAWAFYSVGLRRLYGAILDFNAPSMAVYVKKCGWRVEGCQKEAVFRKGRWCDLYSVAVLKSEFDLLSDKDGFIEAVHPADVNELINVDLFK